MPSNTQILNKDKCYKEVQLMSSGSAKLSDKDLIAKLTQFGLDKDEEGKVIPCFDSQNLRKHIGSNVNYSYKKTLIEYLNIIYAVLNSKKESNDRKSAIISKINEGVTLCTPGFFNRVRSIVESFSLPRNIDEALALLRKNIVTQCAIQHGDGDIHTHNRFFKIALSMGYAIPTDNREDPYRGNIADNKIKNHLTHAFAKNYTLQTIISKVLETPLSHMGYTGLKKEKRYAPLVMDATENFFNQLNHDPGNPIFNKTIKEQGSVPFFL